MKGIAWMVVWVLAATELTPQSIDVKFHTKAQGLPSDEVHLVDTLDGNLILGTDNGAALFRHDSILVFSEVGKDDDKTILGKVIFPGHAFRLRTIAGQFLTAKGLRLANDNGELAQRLADRAANDRMRQGTTFRQGFLAAFEQSTHPAIARNGQQNNWKVKFGTPYGGWMRLVQSGCLCAAGWRPQLPHYARLTAGSFSEELYHGYQVLGRSSCYSLSPGNNIYVANNTMSGMREGVVTWQVRTPSPVLTAAELEDQRWMLGLNQDGALRWSYDTPSAYPVQNQRILQGHSVTDIAPYKGSIWFGTLNAGAAEWMPTSPSLLHGEQTLASNTSPTTTVYSYREQIIAGHLNGGLTIFDMHQGHLREREQRQIGDGQIVNISSQQGDLWVTTTLNAIVLDSAFVEQGIVPWGGMRSLQGQDSAVWAAGRSSIQKIQHFKRVFRPGDFLPERRSDVLQVLDDGVIFGGPGGLEVYHDSTYWSLKSYLPDLSYRIAGLDLAESRNLVLLRGGRLLVLSHTLESIALSRSGTGALIGDSTIWVMGSTDVTRLEPMLQGRKEWYRHRAAEALPLDIRRDAGTLHHGKLIMASTNGVIALRPPDHQGLDLAQGHRTSRIETLGLLQGLQHANDRMAKVRHLRTATAIAMLAVLLIALGKSLRLRSLGKWRQRKSKMTYRWHDQLRALNAQISPHLLFNTLALASREAGSSGATTTTNQLDQLAKLCRKSLEASREGIISLEEELQLVEAFLKVHHLSHQNLAFQIDLPESMNPQDYFLPAGTIQVHVENALIHGILGADITEGNIGIGVRSEGGKLQLCIEDNGQGISYASMGARASKPGSLGGKLVSERLHLLQKLTGTTTRTVITPLRDQRNLITGTMVRIEMPILSTAKL